MQRPIPRQDISTKVALNRHQIPGNQLIVRKAVISPNVTTANSVPGSSPQTDQCYDKHFALDPSVSYEFQSGLAIYFHAKNLTDAPFRVYEGAPNRPIQREYYGQTYEAGVQWKYF
jgi:hypothetical protein